MNLGFVVVQAAADIAHQDGRQHQALADQAIELVTGKGPLLQQHHIKGLPAPLQGAQGIGLGAQVIELVATALEPLATGQQQLRVTEQGGDGEGRLGHRSRDGALNNWNSVDDRAPKRARSVIVFRLPCGRPNDAIPEPMA